MVRSVLMLSHGNCAEQSEGTIEDLWDCLIPFKGIYRFR